MRATETSKYQLFMAGVGNPFTITGCMNCGISQKGRK